MTTLLRRPPESWISEWDVVCPTCNAGLGRKCALTRRSQSKFHRSRKRAMRERIDEIRSGRAVR